MEKEFKCIFCSKVGIGDHSVLSTGSEIFCCGLCNTDYIVYPNNSVLKI